MTRDVSSRPRASPYGTWRSPVTADAIVAGVIGLSQIQLDGDEIFWVEQRPAEAGRNVVVRRGAGGVIDDMTPVGFNARTRVHEYGGGAYLVRQGTVWFSNFADQRLYRQDPGRPPMPITPEKDIRQADLMLDERRQRLIAVREDRGRPEGCGRRPRVDLSTSLVSRRRPVLHLGPEQLVEPLPLACREGRSGDRAAG